LRGPSRRHGRPQACRAAADSKEDEARCLALLLIDRMFKFAFIFGIAFEWLRGPVVANAEALATASLRAVMFMLLAWTILEACRLLVRAVQSLDDQPQQ
jgi:hypothetical protein